MLTRNCEINLMNVPQNVFSFVCDNQFKNISIFHGCSVGTEIYVSRVTVPPRDAKLWSREMKISVHTEHPWLVLFLAYDYLFIL